MIEERGQMRDAAKGRPGASTLAWRHSRWLGSATSALAVLIIVVAWFAARRYAVSWNWPQVSSGLRHEPLSTVATAAAFTLVSFAALGAYDVLGCAAVVPGRIRWATALFAGATGNAISNTLGFHAFTGTAVRLRIYSRAGIRAGDALRVISLSWMGIGLGFVALLSMAGLAGSTSAADTAQPALWTSVALVAAIAVFVVWLSSTGRTLRLGAARLELPSSQAALALVALGAVENGAAIAALYVLLPSGSAPPFIAFALSYASAVALGIVSQVPGGLGVFEAALVSIWAGRIGTELTVALVVYRLVYNLVPFMLSVLALAVWEISVGQRIAADERLLPEVEPPQPQ